MTFYVRHKRTNKYSAKKKALDGINFDSRKEARRYRELTLLSAAGELKDLKLQVPFVISVNGKKVCTYMADFTYTDKAGKFVVEDAKGFKTPIYRLKKKLVEACHSVEIKEV